VMADGSSSIIALTPSTARKGRVSEACRGETVRWPRLSEQFLRIDKWSVCRG
jgi:hypothetical protein